MMDRELGFDLYTLKLIFLVVMSVVVCSCTVFASLGIYEILLSELQEVSAWQDTVLWFSCVYIGLYIGVKLVGRSGWSAIGKTADLAANGEPNIFAELAARDLPIIDDFGKL
jgi:hypothetical protein